MKKNLVLILTTICLGVLAVGSWCGYAQAVSSQSKLLLGKWTNQNETKGPASINITSIDPTTGRLSGTYYPPSGAAAGKEFEIVGWVSSAPPVTNRDNVIVVSFSVSLSSYGSIATWTGFLKENRIIASSSNVRSNTGYEWDHITATYDVWTRNR